MKRSKRLCPTSHGRRIYTIKSCDDIDQSKIKNEGEENAPKKKTTYRWDNVAPFLSNPIEVLRQERLRKERIRDEKLQKEKDKLKQLDNDDISIIELAENVNLNTENHSARVNYNSHKAELDYSGANIKMRICKDIEYIPPDAITYGDLVMLQPECPVLKQEMKETLEFLHVLNDF